MAKLNAQQIGILIITAVMIIGTLGSFAVMIVSSDNQQADSAREQQLQSDFQVKTNEWQKKVDAQNAELTKRYFATFNQFSSKVGKFDRDSIESLVKTDLIVGDGAEIKDDTKFAAYYLGWNPDGTIFDGSVDGDKLKSPFAIEGLKNTAVIEGWKEGLVGMKIGGVRLLEIPSDKAYGEQGSGDKIGPNTPLKFIVMAIDQPKEIPYPEMPEELLKLLYG